MISEQQVKDEISIVKYVDPNYVEPLGTGAHIAKVIRDGKVAVLVSPGHGAGWFSWHGVEALLFDPDIVRWVEEYQALEHKTPEADFDLYTNIEFHCKAKYPDIYIGGADSLEVMWLPIGTHFRIHEYDGYETVEVREEINWMVA